MKADLAGQIDGMKKQAQVMVDSVFSFGELGFQEFETSKYLSGILEKEGFKVERGVAGIPTAFVATWGEGKPVIALGSDIDDIPQASQKPGVAYHDPIIEGAPGHGEGHNSGMPLNIMAALAVKKVMEREHLKGHHQTLAGRRGGAARHEGVLCARRGVSRMSISCCSAHVGANSRCDLWTAPGNGLVSVEYMFKGESAHAAGSAVARKKRAGRRGTDEHRVRISAASICGWRPRVHYVITNGGDQPNVVPPNAAIWFYFREADYDHIMNLWHIGDNMAQGRHAHDGYQLYVAPARQRLAWIFQQADRRGHVREHQESRAAAWSEEDQTLAHALQKELKVPVRGLATKIQPLRRPPRVAAETTVTKGVGVGPTGGGSDDIGDVSWVVPTVTLRIRRIFPAVRATTGPMESRWPRRSRIRAWLRARRCRP